MKMRTLLIGCIFFMACRSQHVSKSPLLPMNGYATTTTIEDSILNKLRGKSNIVLAYSIEDYAWTRNATNYVLALNNSGWKGYSYKAPLSATRMGNNTQTNLSSFDVKQATGDSILQLIANQQAWKIQGDNGSNFCQAAVRDSGAVTVCNITDQPTYKLMIMQGNTVTSASYYAPTYFEKCCPGNDDRRKFLEITSLIKAAVDKPDEQ